MIIDISFRCIENRIQLNFDHFQEVVSHSVENYNGEYEITPKVEDQVLNTNRKFMNDDVKITGIPYYEVSNDHGKTVIIG